LIFRSFTRQWLAARWQAFLGSFDPDENSSSSTPVAIAIAVIMLAGVFVVVGEVPRLRSMSHASATLPCVLLALVGGGLTYVAYRQRCRGTVGSLATLLDNGFYAMSLSRSVLRSPRQ
jgi:protein-S-isoprenylcysteine O-methyltransferase Ste14